MTTYLSASDPRYVALTANPTPDIRKLLNDGCRPVLNDSGQLCLTKRSSGWERVPCAMFPRPTRQFEQLGRSATVAAPAPRIESIPAAVLNANPHYLPELRSSNCFERPFALGWCLRFNTLSGNRCGGHREFIPEMPIDKLFAPEVDVVLAHEPTYRIASTRDGSLKLSAQSGGIVAEFSYLQHNPNLGRAVLQLTVEERRFQKFSFMPGKSTQSRLCKMPDGELVRELRPTGILEITVTNHPVHTSTQLEVHRPHSELLGARSRQILQNRLDVLDALRRLDN